MPARGLSPSLTSSLSLNLPPAHVIPALCLHLPGTVSVPWEQHSRGRDSPRQGQGHTGLGGRPRNSVQCPLPVLPTEAPGVLTSPLVSLSCRRTLCPTASGRFPCSMPPPSPSTSFPSCTRGHQVRTSEPRGRARSSLVFKSRALVDWGPPLLLAVDQKLYSVSLGRSGKSRKSTCLRSSGDNVKCKSSRLSGLQRESGKPLLAPFPVLNFFSSEWDLSRASCSERPRGGPGVRVGSSPIS